MKSTHHNILDIDMAIPGSRYVEEQIEDVNDFLQKEEEILWEGKPNTDLIANVKFSKRDASVLIGIIVLPLFIVIFASPWLFGSEKHLRPIQRSIETSEDKNGKIIFLSVLGAITALLFTGEVVNKMQLRKRARRAGKLAYYMTNKNVIFKVNDRHVTFYAIPLTSIKDIRFMVTRLGHGIICFIPQYGLNTLKTRSIQHNEKREYPTFELMDNVAVLHRDLVKMWRQA